MKLLLSKSPPFLAVEDCSKTSNHLPFCLFFLSVHVCILRERFELLMPKGWGMRYHVGDSLPGRSILTFFMVSSVFSGINYLASYQSHHGLKCEKAGCMDSSRDGVLGTDMGINR